MDEANTELARLNEELRTEIAERERVEKDLRKILEEAQRHRLEAWVLLGTARTILEYQDFKTAAESIFHSCKALLDVAAGSITLLMDDGSEECAFSFASDESPCGDIASLPMPFRRVRDHACRTGKAVFRNDLASDSEVKTAATRQTKIDNTLFAPLLIKGRTVGLITLINKEKAFTDDDVGVVSAFAELAAVALNNIRTLESLEISEERLRSIVQTASDAIISLDSRGVIVFWNHAAEAIFGYTSEEAGGKPLAFVIPERFKQPVEKGLSQVGVLSRSGEVGRTVEVVGLRKDDTEFPAELSYATWKTKEGVFFTGIVRDITERKRMEERLLRAQRLETAGRIAGQVAHDFNNLLSPLTAYPELIKAELPADHHAVPLCSAMMRAAEQMAVINEDLMTLSRRGHFNQEPMSLNGVVKQAASQIPIKREIINVELDLAKDLLPISGSSAQLLRVVSNLMVNGAEAMREGGTLSVRTENVYVDQPLGRYDRIEVGEYVRLDVSDGGHGIPPEIRDKIFDAFFTTKRAGEWRGSGLGLSVVQTIVEDHHGYLDFESEVGKGTTFSIYLPVCRTVVEERQREELPSGTESILIVDDDEGQREVGKLLLHSLGYQVNAVASGEEAVTYLREHPVDLLILDMVMPGLDGPETYRRALGVKPGLRAIIVSGYAESERVQEVQALGAGAYIRKPITLAKLAQAVRAELQRSNLIKQV